MTSVYIGRGQHGQNSQPNVWLAQYRSDQYLESGTDRRYEIELIGLDTQDITRLYHEAGLNNILHKTAWDYVVGTQRAKKEWHVLQGDIPLIQPGVRDALFSVMYIDSLGSVSVERFTKEFFRQIRNNDE